MGHVADTGLRCAVRCGRYALRREGQSLMLVIRYWASADLVGPVGGHGRCEDDSTLDVELDESPSSSTSAIESTKQLVVSSQTYTVWKRAEGLSTYVDIEQGMNLLLCKVQGSLVVRPASVYDHAVDGAALLDDLVNGSCDGRFFRYVGLDGLELARPSLGGSSEFFTRLCVIDRVDDCGAIVET